VGIRDSPAGADIPGVNFGVWKKNHSQQCRVTVALVTYKRAFQLSYFDVALEVYLTLGLTDANQASSRKVVAFSLNKTRPK
jgi:hypothetical protein